MKFNDFFKRATGVGPFPFQVKFAQELPSLVRIPTGLGKTAMAILGWLWRRKKANPGIKDLTPRRLVYCLPMRVLVEQTRDNARKWLNKLGIEDVKVFILMGGEDEEDWTLYPEQDAILIGTQDMMLSRALNRGYAMSRYRWPMAFGLLNNDCLWVMDEVQLMDTGLATSTQLDGFRKKYKFIQNTKTIWMSATLEESWLKTIDSDRAIFDTILELSQNDFDNPCVDSRWHAVKTIQRSSAVIGDTESISSEIIDNHNPNCLTIAIFNTVDRAQDVYKLIKKNQDVTAEVILLHSRYRSQDRARIMERITAPIPEKGRILISTQVVEAGIDLSAKTLFTELAPWPSLVQRFGRCNRQGEYNFDQSAALYWIDLPEEEKTLQRNALPYEISHLIAAKSLLQKVSNAGPASLKDLRRQYSDEYQSAMGMEIDHVIRKRDLIDLFDTTPDLAGADIDISRFIRSGEEHDVQVFWREWPIDQEPDPDNVSGGKPHRIELCTISVSKFREFSKNYWNSIWRWDALSQAWLRVDISAIYPGQVYLIHSSAGGYNTERGWIGYEKKPITVEPVPLETEKNDGYDSDVSSIKPWQTIAQHTDQVMEELDTILEKIVFPEDVTKNLRISIRWHDFGKAHPIFQQAIKDVNHEMHPLERPTEWNYRTDIAKAPNEFWKRYTRNHFRHELASALAMMQVGQPDLSVYLAAAHHGKVRLSIRSLPNEKPPDDSNLLFARGIHDGDRLPETELGGGVVAPEINLCLHCMQLGRSEDGSPSWVERMLNLRDEFGPFRLAFLEALVRSADMRASAKADEQEEVYP